MDDDDVDETYDEEEMSEERVRRLERITLAYEVELAKMDIDSQPRPLTALQRAERVVGVLLESGVPLDAILAKAGLRVVPIDPDDA